MVQGYRGVNINTRDNEESLGDMHMKDYIYGRFFISRMWPQFTFSHLV